MIKFHWECLNEDEYKWMIPVIFDKGIPMSYTKKPKEDIVTRIEKMYHYMVGSRNFVLLISNRSAYVQSLFYSFGLTWFTSTKKQFDIVDLGHIKENPSLYATIEHTHLLMVPHTNMDAYTLRDVRDRIGGLLIKRQVKNMPTIIELYNRKPASSLSNKEIPLLLTSLSSVYGESCAGTFMDKSSNCKIIKMN